MVFIHHPQLRVNSQVPESTVEIWVEQGWLEGLHPDTDPNDDYSPIPSVPPVGDPGAPDPEPITPAKADKTKKEG